LKEGSHIPQVSFIEAFAEFPGESGGKFGEEAFAIGGAGFAALFKFDDMSADLPIGLDLDGIDAACGLLSGLDNQAAQGIE
jgi:hypothetical protein